MATEVDEIAYVSLAEVSIDRFDATQAPKTYNLKAPKTGSFSRLYISYNRGTPTTPNYKEPLFEFTSELNASVVNKLEEDGRTTWQLHVKVDSPTDINGMSICTEGLNKCISKYPGFYGQKTRLEKDLVYRPLDSQTGAFIPGTPGSIWLKIGKDSKFKELVPVKDENGKYVIDPKTGRPQFETPSIDYKLLAEKELKVSVIFHIRDIFKGAKISPQLFVRSCVILEMSEAKDVDHTKSSVIDKYYKSVVEEDPEHFEKLTKEFEKLRTSAPKTPITPSLLKPVEQEPNPQSNQTGQPNNFPMLPAPPQQKYLQYPQQTPTFSQPQTLFNQTPQNYHMPMIQPMENNYFAHQTNFPSM